MTFLQKPRRLSGRHARGYELVGMFFAVNPEARGAMES